MAEAYNFERQYPTVDRGSREVVGALDLEAANTSAEALRAVPAHDLLRAYFGSKMITYSPSLFVTGS